MDCKFLQVSKMKYMQSSEISENPNMLFKMEQLSKIVTSSTLFTFFTYENISFYGNMGIW